MRKGWLIRPTGLVPYGAAYELMHRLAERRARDDIPDALILLEHPPVYTAGRRSDPLHVRWTREQMEAVGAQLRDVDRGGSVTFHGPGQLVGYPILDLGRRPDVVGYLRRIEDVIIASGREIGIDLERDPSATGVWSGRGKVCAIGVRVTRARVTMHGFALNCTTDLSWFDAIVPCGLADRSVTSLSELAGRRVSVDEMVPVVAENFERTFDMALRAAPEGRLADSAAAASA
jgi:lipoyl(octanoyl) transferase